MELLSRRAVKRQLRDNGIVACIFQSTDQLLQNARGPAEPGSIARTGGFRLPTLGPRCHDEHHGLSTLNQEDDPIRHTQWRGVPQNVRGCSAVCVGSIPFGQDDHGDLAGGGCDVVGHAWEAVAELLQELNSFAADGSLGPGGN